MRLELRNSGEPKCESCGAGQLVAAGDNEAIVQSLEAWAQELVARVEEEVSKDTARFYVEEMAERDLASDRFANEVMEAAEKRRYRAKDLRVEIQQIVNEFRQQSIRA